MSDQNETQGATLSGLTLGEGAPTPATDPTPEPVVETEPPALQTESEPPPSQLESAVDDDDPIEDALFSAFLGAMGTGADPNQAFAVAMFEARNAAAGTGIPEPVFDDLTAGFKPIYEQCLGEGMEPRDALKRAIASVDG